MNAAEIARRLLETGEEIDWSPDPDDVDSATPADATRLMSDAPFHEGAQDIVKDARDLYRKLRKEGTLAVVEKSGVDNLSIAQALIQIAIEKRGARGTAKAYKLFQRHGRFVL